MDSCGSSKSYRSFLRAQARKRSHAGGSNFDVTRKKKRNRRGRGSKQRSLDKFHLKKNAQTQERIDFLFAEMRLGRLPFDYDVGRDVYGRGPQADFSISTSLPDVCVTFCSSVAEGLIAGSGLVALGNVGPQDWDPWCGIGPDSCRWNGFLSDFPDLKSDFENHRTSSSVRECTSRPDIQTVLGPEQPVVVEVDVPVPPIGFSSCAVTGECDAFCSQYNDQPLDGCIVICSGPGSGKTTMIRKLAASGIPFADTDHIDRRLKRLSGCVLFTDRWHLLNRSIGILVLPTPDVWSQRCRAERDGWTPLYEDVVYQSRPKALVVTNRYLSDVLRFQRARPSRGRFTTA